MAVNRKGVFFTLIALILVAFLITAQQLRYGPIQQTVIDTSAAATRISIMDNYINIFGQHAANSLESASYFALQNLSAQIQDTNQYLTDINASITFCLNNKTKPTNCLPQNQTIRYQLDQITDIGWTNFSITTKYHIENVWISEERPFEVILWMNISFNVSDPFASWKRHQTIKAAVDVTGIQDPLFALEYANGTLIKNRTFSLTSYRMYQFNNTTFVHFYMNESYISLPVGRSVLQRYTGNLSEDSPCCGIESIVRTQDLQPAIAADERIANWSFVDYQFFQRFDLRFRYDCNQQEVASLKDRDFPTDHWMRLDTFHLFNIYRLNGSENFTCNP